jgi:hypothetical protein
MACVLDGPLFIDIDPADEIDEDSPAFETWLNCEFEAVTMLDCAGEITDVCDKLNKLDCSPCVVECPWREFIELDWAEDVVGCASGELLTVDIPRISLTWALDALIMLDGIGEAERSDLKDVSKLDWPGKSVDFACKELTTLDRMLKIEKDNAIESTTLDVARVVVRPVSRELIPLDCLESWVDCAIEELIRLDWSTEIEGCVVNEGATVDFPESVNDAAIDGLFEGISSTEFCELDAAPEGIETGDSTEMDVAERRLVEERSCNELRTLDFSGDNVGSASNELIVIEVSIKEACEEAGALERRLPLGSIWYSVPA